MGNDSAARNNSGVSIKGGLRAAMVGAGVSEGLFSSVVIQLKEPVKSTERVQIKKVLKHNINSSSKLEIGASWIFFIPSHHCPAP